MIAVDDAPALRFVRDWFAAYQRPYWIVGGWAIDLFVGRISREHSDVDLLVLARDLDHLADVLEPRPVVQHPHTREMRTWRPGEVLTPGPDTLVVPDLDSPAPIQILLAAADGEDWVYHRGSGSLRRPLPDVTLHSPNGLPFLTPELVLMFKANEQRPHDDADLDAALPSLGPDRRRWLADRLVRRHPDHRWLPCLQTGGF